MKWLKFLKHGFLIVANEFGPWWNNIVLQVHYEGGHKVGKDF